jgi:peptidoglycan/xylan/chitin deacetylase (PgdA/CDA1 family)
VRRVVGFAVGVAAAVQVGPAATWLTPVRRRLTPALDGRGRAGAVAITFDDGPHPEGTPAVLDMLDTLSWRATFFVLGTETRKHPELVAEIIRRGHEIGVHGDEHRYLIARLPGDAVADLRAATDTIATAANEAPRWWRPPYGVLSGPALVAARRYAVRPVLWSTWGRDWRADATPESVVGDVVHGAGAEGLDGATVLLHDSDVTSATGSWRTTVEALPLLDEHLSAAGLRTRSLSEHVCP